MTLGSFEKGLPRDVSAQRIGAILSYGLPGEELVIAATPDAAAANSHWRRVRP